jgi:hypothetical protein
MWRALQASDRRSVSRAKRMPAAKANRRTFVPRIDYLEKRLFGDFRGTPRPIHGGPTIG